jgi:RHS repeat-associated protein
MSDNGTMNQVITDHLVSVVAITDASGSLLEETRYMPYGSVRNDLGTVTTTDKSFTGQKSLANTGLLDYNARMYSSELGRFTQPDTIIPGAGNPQSWNRYSYTLNNPVKYTDPSGHMALRDGSMSCDTYLCKTKKAQIIQSIERAKLRKTSTPIPTFTSTNIPTRTPTPTNQAILKAGPSSTPTSPVFLQAGPSSTLTTIPSNTPTTIPTWSGEEQSDRLSYLSRTVDLAEALQMVRIPYLSISIDIWAQSTMDSGKGYSIEYLIYRQSIAVTEGQLIAGIALAGSGLASVPGTATGPGVIAMYSASYVMMSIVMSKAAEHLNETIVYPLFEENFDAYQ